MNEAENIDYKGIGEGLSTAFREDISPSESTISLNGGWHIVNPHQESVPSESTTRPSMDNDQEIKPNADSFASSLKAVPASTSRNGKYTLQNLTPLERYCHCVETHEQLAMGQISDRGSLTQPKELDDSLNTAARLFGGSSRRFSGSSWSILSSASGEEPNTAELDYTPPAIGSPEWQSMGEREQADCLRQIAKLRRRRKTEGSPRQMKPVRVRKRSKQSNESNEVAEA
ncbi:hypothetical protein GGR51DRAFT_568824 [Nemania sp. FL0031]|nr:hypothetical protein GGR51DRAFT_568824 [Nemania sp. FL0031]